MIKTQLWLFLIFLSLFLKVSGQPAAVNSLESRLQKHPQEDTLRINLLNETANLYLKLDKEKALVYAQEADSLSGKLNFHFGRANSSLILGEYYTSNADFKGAANFYLNSINASEKAGNKELLIKSLYEYGNCQLRLEDIQGSLDTLNTCLLICLEEKNQAYEAKVLNSLGNIQLRSGNLDQSKELYNKSLKINLELENTIEVALNYYSLGNFHMEQDQFSEALEFHILALNIYEYKKDKPNIGKSLNIIGLDYRGLQRYSQALKCFKKAIKLFQELGMKYELALCYANISYTYGRLGELEKSNAYFQKGYDLVNELGLQKWAAYLLLINAKFVEPGELLKSVEMQLEALKILEEIGDKRGMGDAYRGLAFNYYPLNKLNKAEKYALKGLEMGEELGALQNQTTMHWLLSEIYNTKENYKQSFFHFKQFKILEDSVYNKKNLEKIANLESQYKFDKEKQALELEQQKKDALKAEEIRIQGIIRNFLIGGVGLTLLFLLIILRSLVQKRKANEILTTQKEEIQKKDNEKEVLLKEIHHRVKNNLQIISSLLNLQTKTIEDPNTLSAVMDGQNRIKAMSLIHQKLYQYDDVAIIDFKAYATQLLRQISGLFPELDQVKMEVVSEDINLDIDTAVPIGLILNELVTNAFKYAFEKNEGQLSIHLKSIDNEYKLEVKDTGAGLPKDFDLSTAKSIGLRLVRRLSRQLYGSSSYQYQNGSHFMITFKDTKERKKVS